MTTRLAKKQEKEFVDTMMYGLRAPLIVTPSYVDGVTSEQTDKHRLYCIAKAIECVKNKEATDYDAMLYYSYASLECSPSRDNAECYMYLFFKFYKDAEKTLGTKCPELDVNQFESIKKLKQWIFKKQMEGMKRAEKNEKVIA